MGADELTAKAQNLREQKNFAEAVIVAREATRTHPDDANAWWQLGLAIQGHQGLKKALEAFTKTTELAPNFGSGWLKLGLAEEEAGLIEEAKVSLRIAFERDSELTTALDRLEELSFQTKDEDEAFWALERLAEADDLSGVQCNRLGILYHNKCNHAQAIHFYRRAAAELEDPAGWINLGLVLAEETVGQPTDAVDALRRGQRLYPAKERFKTMLDTLVPRLVSLANTVRARPTPILTLGEQFQHYINPIELLDLDVEQIEDAGAKELQRAKRKLLHEIELEDGKISWVDGLQVDRSRALALCDELAPDGEAFHHHILVYRDPRLHRFLSRGEIEHFLVRAEDEERPTEAALSDGYDDFGEWLSPIFAGQFNRVLAKMVSQNDMKVVEALLGGRRWVLPKDEDACFVLTRRIVTRLIDALEAVCSRAAKEKLSPAAVKEALARGHLGKLLEMLPGLFSDERSRTFYMLRGVAIDSYNVHEDATLALAHLELPRSLARRSPEHKHKLEADEAKLKEILEEQDKHACRLTWSGKRLEITHAGALYGEKAIPAAQVTSLSWGASINVDGRPGIARYVVTISAGPGRDITIDWTTRETEQQDEYFGKLTFACLVYLMDACIANLHNRFAKGERIHFGAAIASQAGLQVKITGWFRSKDHTIAWSDLRSDMRAGIITLHDRTNTKAAVAMSSRDIPNAVTLHWMAKRNEDPR